MTPPCCRLISCHRKFQVTRQPQVELRSDWLLIIITILYVVELTSRSAWGRVHSKHWDFVAFSCQHFPQHLDEGGFPSTGRTRQTCSHKHDKERQLFIVKCKRLITWIRMMLAPVSWGCSESLARLHFWAWVEFGWSGLRTNHIPQRSGVPILLTYTMCQVCSGSWVCFGIAILSNIPDML